MWPSVGQSLSFSSPSVRWLYQYVYSRGYKAVGIEWDRGCEGLEEKQCIAIPLKPDVGHKTSHLQPVLRNIGVCEPLPPPKTHTPNSNGLISSLLLILCKYDLFSRLHLKRITCEIKEDWFGSNVRMSRSQWIRGGGSHSQTLNLQLHPSLIMLLCINSMLIAWRALVNCVSLYTSTSGSVPRCTSTGVPCQQRVCGAVRTLAVTAVSAGDNLCLLQGLTVFSRLCDHHPTATAGQPAPHTRRHCFHAGSWRPPHADSVDFRRQSCNCLKYLLLLPWGFRHTQSWNPDF